MLMGHEEIPGPLIEDMVSSGMIVVPTLAIRRSAERRVAVSNLRRFLEAGGRVVYGTDLGNEGVSPVDRTEMKLMTKAGMSPEDVLRSATVDAAAWLGLEDRGAIEVGKRADLVAVDGTSSVREMSRVKAVFRAGKPVRRT
jgi:imidazolonepropionase-like amidohydrolase